MWWQIQKLPQHDFNPFLVHLNVKIDINEKNKK